MGGLQATVTSISTNQMIVLAPGGSGPVSVWVTVFGQASNSVVFTYVEPTLTSTPTVTATPTSTPLDKALIYPNPSDDSGPVRIYVPLTGTTDVKIRVYTTAFRKVQELDYSALAPPDPKLILPLVDKWGVKMANGIYYVVVTTNQGRYFAKWLILR
jgi:hypothetical protein